MKGFVLADQQSIPLTRFPLFFLTDRYSLGRRSELPLWRFVAQSLRKLEDYMVTEIRGDWKFLVDLLAIRQKYSSKNICFRCQATQAAGSLPHSSYGLTAPWIATARNNVQFLLECLPDLDSPETCPLVFLPGFSVMWLRACYMHTAHLGLGLYSNGSAIKMLLDTAGFLAGGSKDSKLTDLWKKFREWRQRKKIYTSMPRFRGYLLKEDSFQHIFYHSKAWHSRILTAFISDQLAEAVRQNGGDSVLRLASACMWNLAELYNAVEIAPRYLTQPAPGLRIVFL